MSMRALARDLLLEGDFKAEVAAEARGKPVSILQIGDGNFLRGFADWMIDVANGAGVLNGSVTIAQPLPRGIAAQLEAQEGLFTVLLRGLSRGQPSESRRVVSCVKAALDPYTQWDRLLGCAVDPSLRFVISNTTEAGIAHHDEPLVVGRCPESFPAKVTALLYARFQRFSGSAESGLVFLPCELIEQNGDNLRRIVQAHASAWALPGAFSDWVSEHCHFLNTLVDRIVPGFPTSEAEALFDSLGYRDPLLVAAEPFHLWVIQGPPQLAPELPLRDAGLEVVWTDDLAPYRTRKVRILNGAHTASALASYCAGLDTVREMIDDPVVSAFLKRVMFDEIVPFVPLPEAERRSYAETILERFANPFIRHELISIALNSVSKWRVRVLPSLEDYARAHGKPAPGLALSLAALLHFYRGTFTSENDLVGQRNGRPYPIRDDREVLATFTSAWKGVASPSDLPALARCLLGETRLWGEDLNDIAGLTTFVADALARIERDGVKSAMSALTA